MPRLKKPNLKADVAALRAAYDKAGMNPGLADLAQSSLKRCLDAKDYVAYGMDIQYRYNMIENFDPSKW